MDERENSILTDEEELRAAWEAEGPVEEEQETAQAWADETDGGEDGWEEGDRDSAPPPAEEPNEAAAPEQREAGYGDVRQERERLHTYRQEADPALELVRSYARRSGMELGDYFDYCRRQELTSLGYSEHAAATQVAEEKRTQARERDMHAFIEAYPDVKAESIPAEVWQRVAGGDSLNAAYTMYQNRALEHRLSAERQNRENRQRTPGGLNHGLVGDRRDEIDKLWYSDD